MTPLMDRPGYASPRGDPAKHRYPDHYLVWGFLVAIALHTAALAAGTQLSAIQQGNGYLEEIQVFDASAPITISPVELVPWGQPATPVPHTAAVPLPAADQPPPAIAPRDHRPHVESRPAPRIQQPHRAPDTSTPAAPSAPSQPQPAEPSEAGGAAVSPDGGGGGTVDLGSPSAHGDLPGLGPGGTADGRLPGVGTGAGAGSGSGIGTGSGDGQGAGGGSGQGGSATQGSPGNGGGDQFVSRVADRQQPEVISKGNLVYPRAALEDGVEGTVQLKVLVTETGEVASVEIVRSSGDRRLDAAAKDFVRAWRYRPAVQDGQPRRVYSMATVVFELR